ncbi:hypothetical protein FPQ18DRAFT_57133 [Pyronema domesticum]|uniref:Uncharacterized protein n=1 Tax=Pyronema omphalodes (strain CBS 100304) TaxID=1076935 RepID=U4L0Z9_PYROM|nr:hypothetical protein FPQ18DRAFT_154630 [Pyronema domesticum]KAI5800500.1 hypothetical protein FPQ18DRAFT_57133 [Pyronema domesticum]CCX08495.1 Protein of unknown function [Pyronema omphalodes CBS 100304]
MFAPHLRTSHLATLLQRAPLSLRPSPAPLPNGADIILFPLLSLLVLLKPDAHDPIIIAPKIDRILSCNTSSALIILVVGKAEIAWDLQLSLHTTFPEVTILPVDRIEEIPGMLAEMVKGSRETIPSEADRGKDNVGTNVEEALKVMGLREHSRLVLLDLFGGFGEMAVAAKMRDQRLRVLEEGDRMELEGFFAEERVVDLDAMMMG